MKSCYYRTFCVGGKPTEEHRRYYDTALKWLYDSIDEVRAGTTTREIAQRWPSAKEAWGYADEDEAAANLWGHGLGLGPVRHAGDLADLVPWTIRRRSSPAWSSPSRPSTARCTSFGVRIEEMLIVHEDRTEMISTFPVQEITVAG